MHKNSSPLCGNGERELRRFGLSLGLGLMIVSTVLRLRGKPYFYLPFLSGLVVAITFIMPRALGIVKVLLEKIVRIITIFITGTLLIFLFYVVITPIGIIARLFGKRFLKLGFEDIPSYFEKRETQKLGKDAYERQF